MRKLQPVVTWAFADRAGPPLAREFVPLLAGIAAGGSLAAAARSLGLSYRGAWGVLEAAERSSGATFVVLERGRGSRLSPLGERLVAADAAAQQLLVTNAGALRVPLRHALPMQAMASTLRVAASHDMALAALRAQWRGQHGVELEFHGSAESLALYVSGEVDIAGFHVGGRDSLLVSMLRPSRDQPVRFLRRSQGLILPRGNPRRVKALSDVAAKRLRFVNRQPGSGTRLLLDRLLAQGGLQPGDVEGYANEEFTHLAVAATIAAGKADAGVGLEAAARDFGLTFVPLVREDYLFVCRKRAFRSPRVMAFCALLADAATRVAVDRLAGYALDDPGTPRELARRADGRNVLL
jgi:molybdate transport repressor ModE-like protein